MKKTNQQSASITDALNVDFKEDDTLWLTNSITLRKLIGILGMALPLLLFLFLYIDNGMSNPLPSISHYYYTRVSSIFVSIMSILGIFLIVYKGKEPIDFFISSVAGFFAISVVCFPTSNLSGCCDPLKPFSVMHLNVSPFRENFHYISAAIFLSCLTYMSLFLFTKSDKSPSNRGTKKTIRNRIYRVCGILMFVAILTIFAGFLKIIPEDYYDEHNITFWMETLAVESFGFSWLIKGETLFRDM
ncbi:hypothetical protein [Flavobacterium sp. H122]|uniref:hypothetical protein n=1 Tax=Flavobacterium sp. H122 TaxID=2529860 RepID=UPI0010AAE3D5|nr:hypothetical protein [Flavobacterium sp. H122]